VVLEGDEVEPGVVRGDREVDDRLRIARRRREEGSEAEIVAV